VGLVTKPYQEYRKAQERNARDDNDSIRSPSRSHKQGSSASSISSGNNKTSSKESHGTAAAVARASGRSAKDFATSIGRGTLVDIPVALADGMLATPGLYGEKVKDYGQVKGWKSGMAKGGKAFGMGLVGGLADLVVQPYKGGRNEGAVGVLKGVGKGTVGLVSKVGGGTFGFWAYPLQGIARSMSKLSHTTTEESVKIAKQDEGGFLVWKGKALDIDVTALLIAFDVLTTSRP